MKTRLHFSRCIMLLIVLMSTLGAWAQSSTTATQNVCPGSEPYLVVPGNIANTFQWNISTGNTGVDWTISTQDKASTNVVWANPTVPTTYTLTLTEMDIITFCTTVVSVDVTVYPLPVDYTVTGGGSYCDGGTGLPVGLSGSQSGVNYQLQIGGVNSGTPVLGTGSALNFGTKTAAGTYTVVASTTAVKSCSVIMTGNAIIIINPLPTPAITGLTATPTLSSTVYTTQSGMTGYSWSVSAGGTITAGGTATDNTATVTWNNDGPQTVSVNYNNANLCTALSATVYSVTVGDLPIPTITGPTPVCINSTNNVYVTEGGMTDYTWTVSAGGTITAGGGTSNNTVTVTWNTASAQTVTVNYKNGAGYTATTPTSKTITVTSLPIPTITGVTPVCIGSSEIYATETGMTDYTWVVSAGCTITSGGTALSPTVTITWNTAGPQTVSVIYTNASGCRAISPTVKPVGVNPLPATSPIWHN